MVCQESLRREPLHYVSKIYVNFTSVAGHVQTGVKQSGLSVILLVMTCLIIHVYDIRLYIAIS